MSRTNVKKDWVWPTLIAILIAQLWAAHLCAFFPHEYAHAFTAWALGWKSNPLALDYAHPTLTVLLIQLGINQNVNEASIFASGHGGQAAIIAAAGAVLGNGLITYPLSRWGYAAAKQRQLRGLAMFFYWMTVASIGNFIDYVPIRTFADGGDMFSVERGFGWSPWTVLLVFGIPTMICLIYFLAKIEPKALYWLFPASSAKRAFVAALTAFVLFGFYGAAGWMEGGPISHRMSVISVCIVFPLMAIAGVALMLRPSPQSMEWQHRS